MPLESIPCGKTTTLTQNVVYACPASIFHITSSAALEMSVDNSTFVSVAASTTGTFSSYAFARCTTANAIVSVKKH